MRERMMKLLGKKRTTPVLSRRQRIVLLIAAAYGLILAGLTVFSAQIMESRLPGVRLYYADSGYVGEASYETVVPGECLLSDAEGLFIWLAEEKDTPLGRRIYVRRQPVEVAAAGDDFCALRPVLERNAPVVIGAERELYDGEQVKKWE